ncbi:response regulator transcription factor [Virgibacillus necropolis]|uniref:DNA-binding response regulator n=1 Tax=Virgibacillus necropolis TaxID=163877 RepID=A0A221MGC7_9BACI|nr:response regulator [Virgibacillus necropolis]ASN06695.1 hypothetical protein CFK40_17575 [Virgibacillus necropolis]
MYKVICVDDDYLVLEFLSQMIPWEEMGFIVIGSFQDGATALEHINSEIPDVIITDISMPIMGGIELIRNIKVLDSTIHSIILSCHNDFKYAQQALKLDAFDYILKESMESQMIIDLLNRLKEKLDSEQRTNLEKNQMEYLIKENLNILRSRFLHALLENKHENKPMWWEQQGNELGLDFSFNTCTPVLCFIDQYMLNKEAFGSDELLKFSIDNIVGEILKNEIGKCFSIFYKESMFFIFYPHQQKLYQHQDMQNSLKEIHKQLEDLLKVSITSVTGTSCEFPKSLVKQLKLMISTSDQRFYIEGGSITPMEQTNFSLEDIFTYYVAAEQELKMLTVQEDIESLEKSIHKWISFIYENRYQPNVVKKWVTKILIDINLKFNIMQDFETKHTVPDDLISNVETVYQLEEELKKTFMKLVNSWKHINDLPERNEILKAQRYVLKNLDKKITLGEVADHLHLNPSYFSRLYKRNTGENFIDYVIKSKMENAKELLDRSNESVEKISEMLGYDSKSYFLKTFKKYFGMTPRDYKYSSLGGLAKY